MDAAEKLFTPELANCTLPLVRRIVVDILAIGQKLKSLSLNMGGPEEQAAESLRLVGELETLLAEFKPIGCYFKDWNFECGLVDFPAVIGGKRVMLCWRSDEPVVRFYHAFNEGYAQRREIPAEYLAANAVAAVPT